jgi:hypothetical protein
MAMVVDQAVVVDLMITKLRTTASDSDPAVRLRKTIFTEPLAMSNVLTE